MIEEFVNIKVLEELANSNSKESLKLLLEQGNYSQLQTDLINKISKNVTTAQGYANEVLTFNQHRFVALRERIEEMQTVLMNYANNDFNSEVAMSNSKDIFDALALTINITGEELQHNATLISQRDISIHQKSDALIKTNFELKEALDKQLFLKQELHHRVKNNLQFIAGLLLLKVQETNDSELEKTLLDIQTKIISLSKLHDIMLESGSSDKVEFNNYLSNIGEMLVSASGISGSVKVSGKQFHMRIEAASRLAIVLNEIITNSIKYNWGLELNNQVNIELEVTENELLLHYSEGMSNFNFEYAKKGMGSKLYDMLLLKQFKAIKTSCKTHLNCISFSIPKGLVD